MSEIKTELGQLIDCPEEEFKKFCEDKDVGYLSSFHNLMVQTFNQVKSLKEGLVHQLAQKSQYGIARTEEEQSTLEGLYSKLLRIEQRVFILRDFIKDRSLT